MNMHRAVGFVGVVGTMLLGACFADEGDMPYPGDADNGTGGGGLAGTSETSSGVGGQSGAGGDMSIAASTSSSGGGGTGGGGTRIPCVPTDNDLGDCLGIFVDFKADDLGDGSRDTPYNTWQKAFDDPQSANLPILMCEGTKDTDETVTLDHTVSVWGGLKCKDDAWKLNSGKTTGINAPADTVGLTIDGAQGTVLRGLAVSVANAEAWGGSAVAVVVRNGDLYLQDCTLTAGMGNVGAAGVAGAQGSGGLAGPGGSSAVDCQDDSELDVIGTPMPDQYCGMTPVTGGVGGSSLLTSGVPSRSAPGDGSGNSPGWGTAGTNASICKNGGKGGGGSPGSAGGQGEGQIGVGTLGTDGQYHGLDGMPGGDGTPGGGGGGGKATLGDTCGEQYKVGASGGTGGSGGCGGHGGAGGSAGGMSAALVSVNSTVHVHGGVLTSASGGLGGIGATGGQGGQGGTGGPAGSGNNVANDSCPGGSGGNGGPGGPGGGGQGGHSVGIAFIGTAPDISATTTVAPGSPGAKGVGGNPGMNDGVPGLACKTLDFTNTGDCVP